MTYHYDDLNRPETVTDWDDQATHYTYDAAGRLTDISRPNGVSTAYAYDDANRLVELTHTAGGALLARYAYTVDRVGNRTAVMEVVHYPGDGLLALSGGVGRADRAPLNSDEVRAIVLGEAAASAGSPAPAAEPQSLPAGRRTLSLPTKTSPAAALPGMVSSGRPTSAGLGTQASIWPAAYLKTAARPPYPERTGAMGLDVANGAAGAPPGASAGVAPGISAYEPFAPALVPTTIVTPTASGTEPPAATSTLAPPTLTPAPTPLPTVASATPTLTPISSRSVAEWTHTSSPAPVPTATLVITPTLAPTETPLPTATPVITPTPTETPSPTPTPIEPGAPAEALVHLERAALPADGAGQALLVVLVVDEWGNPVADGTPVSLQASRGQVSPTAAQTTGGLVFARLRAGTEPGAGRVEIHAGEVSAAVNFELEAVPAGQLRVDDGSPADGAPLPFDLAEVVEQARNTVQIPDRGLPFVERDGHHATFDAGGLQFLPLGGRDIPVPLTTTVRLAGIQIGDVPLFEGPAAAPPQVAGNIVRFDRGPGLVEELVGRDGGIEHRFRLEQDPGVDGDLLVAVDVETPLDLGMAEGGDGFVLRWVGSRDEAMVPVARYGRAMALDAAGRAKQAALNVQELDPSRPGLRRYRLEMRFPAGWLAEAQYPVVVDPLVGGLLRLDAALTQPGSQAAPAVAYNSTDGSYLLVWQDNRAGAYDVYGQLVLAGGLLAGENLTITTAAGDQTVPDVAYDPDDDEYLVVWRNGSTGIRGRIVDALGAPAGSELTLATTDTQVDHPAVAYSAAAARWLVAWQQWQGATNENDVSARAVSGTGSLSSAFTVYRNTYDDVLPDVAANGSGGFVVVWEREINPMPPADRDVYAQRTTATATAGTAFAVGSGSGAQVAPAVSYDPDDDQYLVAWQDLNSYDSIWARRVRGQYNPFTGDLIGNAFRVSDGAVSRDQATPAVTYFAPAAAEANGAFVVGWQDLTGLGEIDLWARWVLTDGTPSTLLGLSAAEHSQERVALAYGPSVTETLAAWTDGRAGNQDVYARRVEADGDLGGEFVAHPAPGDQTVPQVAYNPDDDEYLVVWQDYRHGVDNPDVYAQRVAGEGILIGENITVTSAAYRQTGPRIAYATTGHVYLVAWRHHPSAADYSDIYGQIISATGQLKGAFPIALHYNASDDRSPTDIVYNSDVDRFLVLWNDHRFSGDGYEVWGRQVLTTGAMEDEFGVTSVSALGTYEDSGTGSYDPQDDQYLIAWRYRSSSGAPGQVFGRRIVSGTVMFTETIQIATGAAVEQNPDVVYLPDGNRYAVVWEDARNINYDVYARLVSPAGSLIGSSFAVATGNNVDDRFPRVIADGLGGAMVVWERANGSMGSDLYGRYLGTEGELNSASLTLLETADNQQRPAIAGDRSTGFLLAWQDDRNGTWDIYGSLFEPLQADFVADPASGAAPLHVTFTDQSTPAGAADEWRWAFGDGESSTAQNPVHTYPDMGFYPVTQWVTDTATGETDVLTRTAYVAVSRPVTTVITYDYDPLYRLISATYSTGEVYTYTYDQVGNRRYMGVNGRVITYTYDAANRLTNAGGVTYNWDDAGNLLDDGVRTYQYDPTSVATG